MREDRVHLMALKYVVERIDLKILAAHGKMIGYWIELNPMNRLL
jgi:hypothetical protein